MRGSPEYLNAVVGGFQDGFKHQMLGQCSAGFEVVTLHDVQAFGSSGTLTS